MVSNINSTTAQRIQEAERKLGRKLTPKEKAAILNPPKQKSGKGTSIEQTNLKPATIAKNFKASAENHWGAVDTQEFQDLLNNVNKDNVIDMLKEYDRISPDESFIEMICDEKGNSSADRKSAISNVFNKLLTKAKEAGVEVSHFKNSFNAELNHQFNKIGFTNTEKLDEIVNALIQAVNNKEQLSATDRAEIDKTPATKLHTAADKLLATRINSAQKSFNNQLKQDGWAGDVADFVGKLCGSENTADNIRKDLKLAKNQFAQLEAAKKEGSAAYEAKFQEIFGTKFDPHSIKVYEKKEKIYAEASAHHGIEEYFKNQSGYFLKHKGLSNEYSTMPGTVPTTYKSATKEQVYDREVKKFANFLGENGQQLLADKLKEAGLEKADVDKKFAFVQKMAKDIAGQLHQNTVKAGGGKEFNQVQHEYEYSYKAAFGVKNDIMKRVTDYNISQQVGAGAVKAGVVIGASLAAAFTGGASLAAVAGVTAGATVVTEVTDKFSSGEVMDTLKADGFAAAIKKGNENTNYTEIFKQAVVSGGMVLVGGGVAKGVQFASKGLTTVQQATAMFGADVVTGMAAEKLMTGEITVGGTVFNVLLSGAGNIVAVKMAAKAAQGGKASQATAESKPTPAQMREQYPDMVERLGTYKATDGKPLFTSSEIDDILRECSKTIEKNPAQIYAILDNPEEITSIMTWKNRGAGLWRAIGEPFESTIKAHPEAFGIKQASPEFKAKFGEAKSTQDLEALVQNSTNPAEIDYVIKQLESRPITINKSIIDNIVAGAKNKTAALKATPEKLMNPTRADNIAGQGISFKQAPDQPVYKCTKIEWGKTVEETIALNKKNGINIELVADADGNYFMGIKDIWSEGGYHRIDRNSAVMQYGKYPKTDQYVDQAWAAKNADADGNIMDCAVIANDKGAQILENSYVTESGQKIDFATMEAGTPVRKDPNATVNAVAYESPQKLTTLEGPITTDITMGDVDGNVYNNFKQLKKQITKGQLVPNEADPNSARFIELVKAGDDDAAIALLKQATGASNKSIVTLAEAGFTDDVIKELNTNFYGPELVDETLNMVNYLEEQVAAGKPITKELIENAIDEFSPGASGGSAATQRSMLAKHWRYGEQVYNAYKK
ncbi:MAG: hypothetical protein NC390_05600 [Fusobacterium sp.]|nr:hypothetical protein [Fusobacterium sp.]